MSKLDPTVKKETVYIAVWVILFSMLMQAVFLILGKWDVTVLAGNILGGTAAVVNFLLMGKTVQNAVDKEPDEAKNLVRASQMYRMMGLVLVAVVGFAVPVFHTLAVILPLLFPRIAIAFRPLFDKHMS